ncbi:peptidoglycan-binding domain-containing protein [Camelimonas sp. ID_303_24]
MLTALRRRLLARPGRAAFIIASTGLAMGVFVNALAMQHGAHPNPMFGSSRPVTVMAHPPAAVRPPPAKPPAAQPQQAVAREAAAGQGAAPAPAVAPETAARRGDAIGDLLKGGSAPMPPPRPAAAPQTHAAQPAAAKPQPAAAKPQPAAPAKPQPAPQVASAQKALGKLGFGALDADGRMGPGTRAAIERFEKARGLPVTGELNPKTLKALGAAAGAPIR